VTVDRITEFLATVPLFREIERTALRTFAEITREQRYPKHAVIVSEGDPGDALFVVRAGEVKVVLVGEDGREVILNVLGQGDHFGELSLIDGRPRSAHVVATSPASMLILRRADFRRRVEAQPQVAWALLTELSRRLRQADSAIGSLVMLDVPGRVAKVLLDHATPGEPAQLVRALTHQTIEELAASGAISVDKRQVTIADRRALELRARPRL
jgi:CRP/FNR family transcriptional regulator, cyclic AMP receptor protein